MKKLSLLILCCVLSSKNALSKNTTDSDYSFEYARQSFNHVELPLYSVYFPTQIQAYWNQEDFIQHLPETMSFLDWTALVHLGLFAGSVLENGEVPGFRSQNATLLDRVLIADNELYMPLYGALVAYVKISSYLGVWDPTRVLALAIDNYFAVEVVAKTVLAKLSKSLNDGKEFEREESQVIPVPSQIDVSFLAPYLNALSFSTGLVQLLALTQGAKSQAYQDAMLYRGLFLTGAFLLWGTSGLSTAGAESLKFFSWLQTQLNLQYAPQDL